MTLTTNGSVDEGKLKEVSLKLGTEIIASKSNDEKKAEYHSGSIPWSFGQQKLHSL